MLFYLQKVVSPLVSPLHNTTDLDVDIPAFTGCQSIHFVSSAFYFEKWFLMFCIKRKYARERSIARYRRGFLR